MISTMKEEIEMEATENCLDTKAHLQVGRRKIIWPSLFCHAYKFWYFSEYQNLQVSLGLWHGSPALSSVGEESLKRLKSSGLTSTSQEDLSYHGFLLDSFNQKHQLCLGNRVRAEKNPRGWRLRPLWILGMLREPESCWNQSPKTVSNSTWFTWTWEPGPQKQLCLGSVPRRAPRPRKCDSGLPAENEGSVHLRRVGERLLENVIQHQQQP